jgi:hypothetical protein
MSGSVHFPWGVIEPSPQSCYSSLAGYGTHGAVDGIVAPRPTSLIPAILRKLGPNHVQMRKLTNIPSVSSCPPYATLGEHTTCPKEEFRHMYRY